MAFAIRVRHRPAVRAAPIGLIKLAAFFGTLKLAVAAICAVHIADRLRCLAGGKPASEVLEGGLILVVLITIASVGPAVWSQNTELVREHVLQLALAALATALCIVERSYQTGQNETAADRVDATPRGAPWYSPFR